MPRAATCAEPRHARAAWVTPATASGHLARLLDAGFVAREQRGRHRYDRLADRWLRRVTGERALQLAPSGQAAVAAVIERCAETGL